MDTAARQVTGDDDRTADHAHAHAGPQGASNAHAGANGAAGAPPDASWTLPRDPGPHDPLVGCLQVLTRLLGRPASPDALVAGLPLVGNRLTPEFLPRAAERGGLAARLIRRPLKDLTALQLPALLLLDRMDACVLVSVDAAGEEATILGPDSAYGELKLPMASLQARYAGHLLLAKPAYRLDARVDEARVPDGRHWLRSAITRTWPIYAQVLVASLLINLFGLVMPMFTMNVYDRVVPNHAIDTLWALAIGAAIVTGFDLLVRTLRAYFVDTAGRKVDVALSAAIHRRLMGLQMKDRPQSVGAFLSSVTEFESVREFLTSATIATLVDLPFVLLFVGAMFWIGGPLGWIAVLAIPVILAVSLAVQSALGKLVAQTMRLTSQRQANLVEALVGLEAIKVAGAQGHAQLRWEQTIALIAKLGQRSRLLSTLAINFAGFAQQLANIAVVIGGVLLIAEDKLTMGALIACTILAGRALAPLGQVAALVTRMHQSRNALRSIDRMMQLPVERPEDRVFVDRPRLAGHLELRKVGFTYPGSKVPALQDVSFRISAGERVAIIGRTGSGKTTIEKLLLGLYEPTEGAVLADDVDLRQIDPSALRRDIGHVPQDVALFFGSVRDNIVLGAPYSDDLAILRAATIGGVDAFVDRSAAGFDLQVGERGERLSGGQRQAIAIARAELTRPPVLLMDEPSSAMDNGSEEQFKARLASELGGRTLVLITHRSSLLSLVDRLIVVDQGRIVADGPKEAVLTALATGKVHVGTH